MFDWGDRVTLLIAGAALALEMRRWYESGPRLQISIMADALEFPDDDGKDKLAITVTNRGTMETTLTHFVAYGFKTPLHRLFHRSMMAGLVGNPTLQPLPPDLGANRRWMGKLIYTEKLKELRRKGQLYVGVAASHSGKSFLKRVPRKKADLPEEQLDRNT